VSTLMVALPSAVLSVGTKLLSDFDYLGPLDHPKSIMMDNAVWSGFTFLVGFLIVFRTSQAYDGCTSTHMMRAEWFDAVSAIVAFCKFSSAKKESIVSFQKSLVTLFSLLHALALAELEDSNSDDLSDIVAFDYDIAGVENIDDQSLRAIKESDSKVELVYQWIQQMLVENIATGVLSIPAPILSRVFQEIANGMVQFHEALKISTIPFPFPYAQTCDTLLLMHWLVTPIVISQWVSRPEGAFIFTFMQVFVVWSLRSIATEIENPFGLDANDIDSKAMQLELNRNLLMLLEPSTQRTPVLPATPAHGKALVRRRSLHEAWAWMEGATEVSITRSGRRSDREFSRKSSKSASFGKSSKSASFGGDDDAMRKCSTDKKSITLRLSPTSLLRSIPSDFVKRLSDVSPKQSGGSGASRGKVPSTPEPKLEESLPGSSADELRLEFRTPQEGQMKVGELMRRPPEEARDTVLDPGPVCDAFTIGGSCSSQGLAGSQDAGSLSAAVAHRPSSAHSSESVWRASVRDPGGQLESMCRDGATWRGPGTLERAAQDRGRGGYGGAGPALAGCAPQRPPGDAPPKWRCCEVRSPPTSTRQTVHTGREYKEVGSSSLPAGPELHRAGEVGPILGRRRLSQ